MKQLTVYGLRFTVKAFTTKGTQVTKVKDQIKHELQNQTPPSAKSGREGGATEILIFHCVCDGVINDVSPCGFACGLACGFCCWSWPV